MQDFLCIRMNADYGGGDVTDKIEHIRRMMGNAIKGRDKFQARLEKPINKFNGQPLSPYTVRQLRTKMNQCTA
jgi:hypothetical protein